MLLGFRLVPDQLSEQDVQSAVREMQTGSSAEVALLPFRRDLFDECLLRLAHFAAARTPSLRRAEAPRRLDELMRAMLVYNVPKMRSVMHAHMLREACTMGDLSRVRVLIAEGVAVDAKGYDGWTALHRSCAHGHEDCARALIQANASLPQKTNEGFTAVHWAAEFGHLHVMRLLLHARAMVADVSDEEMWTPMHRAAIDGHVQIVKLLIEHKTPVNGRDRRGDTALHDAARNGHLPVVRALLDAKATPDMPNHSGQSPLDMAQRARRTEVAELLITRMRAATSRRPSDPYRDDRGGL